MDILRSKSKAVKKRNRKAMVQISEPGSEKSVNNQEKKKIKSVYNHIGSVRKVARFIENLKLRRIPPKDKLNSI